VDVAMVSTADQSLLRSVRGTLEDSTDALLCVAFVHSRGVHLIERELRELTRRGSARMVVTTTFDQTGGVALGVAQNLGARIRTLNPGSGSTFHPKVYLGRSGSKLSAFVGSANLTGGLATNVEVGVLLRGTVNDKPLSDLKTWAEAVYEQGEPWIAPVADSEGDDVLEPDLLLGISREAKRNSLFHTLGRNPAPNVVTEVTRSEVFVETARSKGRRQRAEPVPAWMFNLAWDYLRSKGELTNAFLLNQLRVHRSSAVCAILARMPGVEAVQGSKVALRLVRGAKQSRRSKRE